MSLLEKLKGPTVPVDKAGFEPTERWEYHTTVLPFSMEHMGSATALGSYYNDMGAHGWELIAIFGKTIFFKRRLP